MSVQTAIYKTALAEIPPGAGKINIFFSRAAVRKVAVDKAESALFAKRMGRRGNVTDPSFVVNGYKTAAFEICFRATENIIHGAVNVTAVKKMHIRALAVKLPSRDKAAVADDEVVGERGKKKRVLRWFVSLDKVADATIPDMSETKSYKEYKQGVGMPNYGTPGDDGFMNIPDNIDDSELPFN